MIELLTEQSDVLKFLKLNDEVESKLHMERSEWIQWLMDSIDNEKIHVWINKEDEIISGYVAAINNIVLPISNSVLIYYIWVENSNQFVDGSYSRNSLRGVQELVDKVKNWKIELNADSVVGNTTIPEGLYERFGFKEVSRFIEWRK